MRTRSARARGSSANYIFLLRPIAACPFSGNFEVGKDKANCAVYDEIASRLAFPEVELNPIAGRFNVIAAFGVCLFLQRLR